MTKPISARVHGVLDYAVAAVFLNAPMVFGFQHTRASTIAYWLTGIFGFSDQSVSRNFFVAMGILILIVVALSDYTLRETLPPRQPGDRRRWGTREPAPGETPKTT